MAFFKEGRKASPKCHHREPPKSSVPFRWW